MPATISIMRPDWPSPARATFATKGLARQRVATSIRTVRRSGGKVSRTARNVWSICQSGYIGLTISLA